MSELMTQARPADVVYGSATASDPAGLPLELSVYADRPAVRQQLAEEARAAGFRLRGIESLEALADDRARPLAGTLLVDCPAVDARTLATMARLDARAAHGGVELVVATTLDALERLFACMDQSGAEFLVDASRADRVVTLARVLSRQGEARLRELSDDDRTMLLRLTEQVGQIAARLDRVIEDDGVAGQSDESAFRFESPKNAFRGADEEEHVLGRTARPALPDPRLVRRILRQRQLRARFFDGDLFADPAWDMLLDLTAARAEHKRVSVTSLCIASAVPPTTALRWISQLVEAGLFERIEDDTDRRRAFIALSDQGADAMARYFAELGKDAKRLV